MTQAFRAGRRAAAIAGLSGATALALGLPALIGGRGAAAQTPAAAPAQAPGFFRFKLGGFTVTMVHDGHRTLPSIDGFVANAPVEEVRKVLAESFLPAKGFAIPFTVTFVDTGRALVAFDAGNGVTPPGSTHGRMTANLAAAGIDPAKVTAVVHSHFHGDHIGGLLDAGGARFFPNAEIVVPAAEWAWWTDTANESRSPERQRGTFANTARRFAPYQGRIRQIADGAEVLPGIRAVAAHGHTPGHTAYHVADGDGQMMFVADLVNRPELFARRPDFHIMFDFDPAAAEASRRRLLDRVAAERMRVTGYHFPFPANGFMAKEGNGYRYVPADWSGAGV